MAATESLSSWPPQANSQPEPPIAHAPNPIGVINRSELPNCFVFTTILPPSGIDVVVEGGVERHPPSSPQCRSRAKPRPVLGVLARVSTRNASWLPGDPAIPAQ